MAIEIDDNDQFDHLPAPPSLEERVADWQRLLSDLEGHLYHLGAGAESDRKSTRLNSSHSGESRMPSSA